MTQTGTELSIDQLDRGADVTYQLCAKQGVRYAMSILRNQSDAEEAVQEAFCRIHRQPVKNNPSAYRGKFFVTLRNHCIDLLRRRKVRKEVELVQDCQSGVADRSHENEVIAALESAMSRLPDDWRQVLQLRIHGELSYKEIAELTGSSFDQVRTWIYRGRKQLEADLTKSGIINPNNQSC